MNNNTLTIEDHICDYGCGQLAKYKFKNGKYCCHKISAQCPAVKEKLARTVQANNAEWKQNGEDCRHHLHKKDKRVRKHIDNHGKCDNPGCTNYNDGSYGSGRFCSQHCAYAYSMNRHDPNHYAKICKHLQKNRDLGLISQKGPYGTWKCDKCNLIFETRSELENHNKLEHGHISAKILKGKEKTFACPFCLKEFNTDRQMCGHISNCPNHPNKEQHDLAHKRSGETYSNRQKQGLYQNNGGFGKGSHHSLETREKISITRANQVKNEYLTNFHAKVKWYKVSNIKGEEFNVRGTWEVNVAKRLNELNIYWIKAPSIKYFNEYWHNYTADLYIPDKDIYIEVKGRYPDTDRLKMNLVTSQNPDKKIYFIHGSIYWDFIAGKISFDDKLLISQYDL